MKTLAAALALAASISIAARADSGIAQVKATTTAFPVAGTVTFTDTKDGLKVVAQLTGVPLGQHGFHIHEFGSCDDAAKAAGAHYDPEGTHHHGMVMKEGVKKTHAGDMGNITAGPDGTANLEVTIPKVSLTGGKYDVAGRAVVIHEKVDDFSQPAGNAGARIGCGVIAIAPAVGVQK